jgi:hypothetical protein
MAPTLSDVETIARESRGEKDSVNRCRAVNSAVSTALDRELGVESRVVRGAVQDFEGNIAYHVYVRIPAGQLDDCESEVIVDGALDQFNDAEFATDTVHATFGPKGSVPKVVVAIPGSREFSFFTTGA